MNSEERIAWEVVQDLNLNDGRSLRNVIVKDTDRARLVRKFQLALYKATIYTFDQVMAERANSVNYLRHMAEHDPDRASIYHKLADDLSDSKHIGSPRDGSI